MSMILEGQTIAWRTPAKPRVRVSLIQLLRATVIAVSIIAAAVYFATSSEIASVVSGLLRESRARPTSASSDREDTQSPVAVALRQTAHEAQALKP